MAAKFARSEDFKTPPCRLSFAHTLFKPRAQEEGKPKKYGCTLIFGLEHRAALEQQVANVIREQWGDKGIERAKNGAIKSPFLAGNGKEARNKKTGDLHAGMGDHVFFIRCQANEDRPPVVRYKSANIPATETEVYSGCRGFAVVNCFAWNHPTNGDGVSFGIQYFQKTADDERFGGSSEVDPEKWHEKIEDTGTMSSSTTEGAGAGGLFG